MYTLGSDKPILEVTQDWFDSYLAVALARYGEVNQRVDGGTTRPVGWFAETFGNECPLGGRDNTAAAFAGKLLNGLHPNDVRAIMFVWAEAKCVPPLPRQDIERIVSSLERKRRFDNAVQANSTAQSVADEPPIDTGPEDEWFADLLPPTRPTGDGDGAVSSD